MPQNTVLLTGPQLIAALHATTTAVKVFRTGETIPSEKAIAAYCIGLCKSATYVGTVHKRSHRVTKIREMESRKTLPFLACYRNTAAPVLQPSIEWLRSRESSYGGR